MKTRNRLVWISGGLLLATAVAAQEPSNASDRVANAAMQELSQDTDARLAEIQRTIEDRVTARLERAADTRIASHFERRWMGGPPVPARPVRSLPARRSTVLAGSETKPAPPTPVAGTAVRLRTDQEPFGG